MFLPYGSGQSGAGLGLRTGESHCFLVSVLNHISDLRWNVSMLQTKAITFLNSMGTNGDSCLHQLIQALRFELGNSQTRIKHYLHIAVSCRLPSFPNPGK